MSSVIDALAGVEFSNEIPDGELVADVILISRLVNEETGRETFHLTANTNQSVIVQLGLIHAAVRVIDDGDWSVDGEEEDD